MQPLHPTMMQWITVPQGQISDQAPVEPNSKTCVFVDPQAAVVGVPILQEGFWECPVNLRGHEELSLLFKQQCQTLANKASAQLHEIQEKHPGISVSVGSIGHPETCNWPCRFMKRAAGCVHGAACARCHLCAWSKTSLKMQAAWKKAHSAEADGSKAIVSVGSIGHPQQCAWACRFMKRSAGCHNKAACPRCHLCTWSKATLKMEAAAKRLQPMAMQIACIPATYNTYQLVSANGSGTDSCAVAHTLPEKETPDTDEDVEGDDF